MEKMNNKPLSLMISELKQNIAETINHSGLPIYISEMVLRDIVNDVTQASNRIKETEYQQYMMLQIEETTNKETENMNNKDIK